MDRSPKTNSQYELPPLFSSCKWVKRHYEVDGALTSSQNVRTHTHTQSNAKMF